MSKPALQGAERASAAQSVRLCCVLLVEDDDQVRRSLHLLLHAHGYDVRSYAGMTPILADKGTRAATHLIADYRLTDGDGIGVLRALRRDGWPGRAILITAYPTAALIAAARASGFDRVIEKPLRQHDLIGALI